MRELERLVASDEGCVLRELERLVAEHAALPNEPRRGRRPRVSATSSGLLLRRKRAVALTSAFVVFAMVAFALYRLPRAFDALNRRDILLVEAKRTGCPASAISVREFCASEPESTAYVVDNLCARTTQTYECWRGLPAGTYSPLAWDERDCMRVVPKCGAR